MRAPSALIAGVRKRFADWRLEQRIAAVKGRLIRCMVREQSDALMHQLRGLVAQRSPEQVARMEMRKGLR